MKKKKNKNKQGVNHPTTDNHVGSVDDIEKSTNTCSKSKIPLQSL
jgi:hypothetical protein